MPADDQEKMTETVYVRCSPTMAKALDDWRRSEPDLPTRAEALRRIAAKALKIKEDKPEKPAKGRKP
jgi:hypothetical protein